MYPNSKSPSTSIRHCSSISADPDHQPVTPRNDDKAGRQRRRRRAGSAELCAFQHYTAVLNVTTVPVLTNVKERNTSRDRLSVSSPAIFEMITSAYRLMPAKEEPRSNSGRTGITPRYPLFYCSLAQFTIDRSFGIRGKAHGQNCPDWSR